MNTIENEIIDIWTNHIKKEYLKGFICSERQLQGIFFKHLNDKFKDSQIWIEPNIKLDNGQSIIPDIIITENKTIVASIELKYVPHHFPVWQEDIGKFNLLATQGDHVFYFNTNPKTGDYDFDQKYQITENTFFCFCAVGSDQSDAVYQLPLTDLKIKNKLIHLVGRIRNQVNIEDLIFERITYF
jgi:hypothetical protein